MMPRRRSLLTIVLSLLVVPPAFAERKLTVTAGKLDRVNSIVTFDAGGKIGEGTWQLVGGPCIAGTLLQVTPGGRGVFILGDLKAGETCTFSLQTYQPIRYGGIIVKAEDGNIDFAFGGHEILRYQGEKTLPPDYEPQFARGGYIHPAYTPSGKLVTDDFPPKHKHHHGVWSPWTKTEFEGRTPDFWNMGQKTGTVEVVDKPVAFSGEVASGFTARHRMVDLTAKPQAKPAIDERWDVVVYTPQQGARKPAYVFDWMTTQTCASDSRLLLPKYYYGGLGYRGHRQWDGKDNCFFLTSEGNDRSNGNETRGKWCHAGGKVDGERAGVAILCHPGNFRFPQPMRLHPDEPFFCYAPSQLGDWSIEPGKPYVARYRFVVSDGPPDKGEIERLWNDYAEPPAVTVE